MGWSVLCCWHYRSVSYISVDQSVHMIGSDTTHSYPLNLHWYVRFYTHVIHPTSPRYYSIVAGVAINFVGRARQGKKPFTKEITDDYCKYRAGKISITQSFILHGIIVFLAFTFFLVISCWLILRDNTVPDGTKYQLERIESGI